MFFVLLILNFLSAIAFLFSIDHKKILSCSLFAILGLFLISLFEKNYYVAALFLLEMSLLHKFTTIVLVNEKPRQEDNKKEKNNFYPFLAVCLFCSLVSGYCLLTYRDIEIINSLNLDFDTTEIYKVVIILISSLLLLVGLREIKK